MAIGPVISMTKDLATEIDEIRSRFQSNLDRVRSLVNVYEQVGPAGQGRRSVRDTDLLRAAIVLLHATAEDLLRSLAELFLPMASQDSLLRLKIPFITSNDGRPERISLAELAKYRGLTVDQVLKQVIRRYLERSNFNCTLPEVTLVMPPS